MRVAHCLARFIPFLALLALSTAGAAALPATPVAGDAPRPILFPRDDGPHDSTIEWWYFTGHLATSDGARYGFQYVVFRARTGSLEGYVAHFALTDHRRRAFQYDQRILGSEGIAGGAATLDLDLDGWTMHGGDGRFDLAAGMSGYAIDLDVATTKPAALHDGDGYIDYGNGTASWYYSWTRMDVSGTLALGEERQPVTGEAWMDHQWGNFETYQDGGWDWFAVQLADGTDVMLYVVRDPAGRPAIVDGSIVAADGDLSVLGTGDFTVSATGQWTSPATGATYPSGWAIAIPAHELTMTVEPVLTDQELDTRRTTGVIYWEGEAIVDAMRGGRPVAGLGYVELTGYAPYEPLDLAGFVATPTR
jgi:predicted secreted hydrolase